MRKYKECEDMATLLDDGVVWLEIAEQIKDMEYITKLKGLADLDHCFHMRLAIKNALGSLDVAGTGRALQRGYITEDEYTKAEEVIKPLEEACNLPHDKSRELFSTAIKYARELMATKVCECLIKE